MNHCDSPSKVDSSSRAIKVVAGIIWHPANTNIRALRAAACGGGEIRMSTPVNPGDRILLALRQAHQHQGGLWEFPGGKVDVGESGADALRRELHEEIAIDVLEAASWMQVSHDYPDKSVDLEFWHVAVFSGEPEGCEQQELRWVMMRELHTYAFPQANQAVVDALLKLCSQ